MIKELERILPQIPDILNTKPDRTLLIDKYPPIIHRISYQIADDRWVYLHRLFNTDGAIAYMHSHSWDFACKVLEGGYEMGIGFSNDREKPPEATTTTFVKSGDMYDMVSSDVWHYTKPRKGQKDSYSIMLVGPRKRPRKAQNNSPLTDEQQQSLINWFKEKFPCTNCHGTGYKIDYDTWVNTEPCYKCTNN